MNNSTVVSKRSSFMIEDILRCTHAPQDELLTHDSPSTPLEDQENLYTCDPNVPSKAKATRVHPSIEQKRFLLDAFSIQPNPSKEEMIQLADYIGFKFEKVRRWFENRRKTEKRRNFKKLRELDDLASSISSPRQPVSKANHLQSSYFGNQTCTSIPVPYPSAATCRNYGLVQRSYIRPMPLYRRAVQTSRGETVPKSAYKLTHASNHMPLTQMNALPSSLVRSVYSCKVPVTLYIDFKFDK